MSSAMKSKYIWPIAAVVSIVAASASAIASVVAMYEGRTIHVLLALAATILFIICSILAFKVNVKMNELQEEGDEISVFKLKRPGLARSNGDEIVPKGKMPVQQFRSEEQIFAKKNVPEEEQYRIGGEKGLREKEQSCEEGRETL